MSPPKKLICLAGLALALLVPADGYNLVLAITP